MEASDPCGHEAMTASESTPTDGERSDGSTDSESTSVAGVATETRSVDSSARCVVKRSGPSALQLCIYSDGSVTQLFLEPSEAWSLIDELGSVVESIEDDE